jgi:L-rhamnose mutarotase
MRCVAAALAGLAAVSGCAHRDRAPEAARYGMVIGIKPERIEEYKALHAACWPGVLEMIRRCNIRNYSIYLGELQEGKHYLFGYFEYVGGDFEADMEKMKADPTTLRWWKETDPCQLPLPTREEGEWWAAMEEVFHTE